MGYSIQSQGAIPKYAAANPNYGVLAPQAPNMSVAPKVNPSTGTSSSLASNPFGNPSSGIIGAINNATGLSPKPTTGTNPGMLPSTPVKSISTADGTTTTFHPTTTSGSTSSSSGSSSGNATASSPTQSSYDATTGFVTPYGLSQGAKPVQPNDPNQPKAPVNATPPGTVGNNGTNFQQNLGNTAASGNETANEQQTYQGLVGQSQAPSQAYLDAQAEAKRISDQETANAADYAHKTNNIAGTAGFLTQQNGEQGLLNNQYNTVQGALTNQYAGATNRLGAANTQQSLQVQAGTAANTAAQTQAARATGANESVQGATAPQYGVQPGTLVGQPGQPNGGIDQGYLGGITAPANIKSAQDFTTQINTTQKSVDTLNNLASQIVPNMGTTGFNPTSSPIGNQTFSQYFTEKNPAAKAGLVAGLGEIKNQISNVIASATGLTPSGVTAVADTYDLTNLNPQQLNDFLQYINQYAQSNIDAAQKGVDRIKSGGSVTSNPGLLPAPTANNTGKAALGTGATLAAGLVSKIVSEAGNAVAGGVAGAAATILK